MLCQNCGKNEVNFKYTQIINGVKKEMALCDKCAKSLGLESLDFNMPINFSSFLGDFFVGDSEGEFLPTFTKNTKVQCDKCGLTYEEFANSGKFGCEHCYGVFANKINPVLKNIHGSDHHVGRIGRMVKHEQSSNKQEKDNIEIHDNETKNEGQKDNNKTKLSTDAKNKEKITNLQKDLKIAIKEERYEDAAKLRDEIKKLENK